MAVTDADRHDLFVAARDALGERPADTLMEMLPPVGWGDVARRPDVDNLRTEMQAGFLAARSDVEGVRAEMKAGLMACRSDVDNLRTEMHAGFARLDARIDAQFARIVMANLAIMVALLGLVLAAMQAA